MHYKKLIMKALAPIIAIILINCSQVPVMDLANQDLVSPGSVSQFRATTGTNQISLQWQNPTDRDFKSVRIVRKTGSYPANASDGSVVYEGSDIATVDSATTNYTEYFYAAYAVDMSSNLSTPAQSKSASCPASITCPSNYLLVGANSSVGAYCQFCVAQFEMKDVGGVATSQAAGVPWVSVTQEQARNNCTALGSGYHLTTNPERMAISREIEARASNWSSGTTGSGSINRGWSAYTGHGDAWTNTGPASSAGAGCLYNTGANTCGAGGTHTYKRTHELSNGSTIWDISGNVAEWIDWILESKDLAYSLGPITANQYEFTGVKSTSGMSSNTWQPSITSLDSSNGIGLYNIGGGSVVGPVRGSGFENGPQAGIYALSFNSTGASNLRIGFRCAYTQ